MNQVSDLCVQRSKAASRIHHVAVCATALKLIVGTAVYHTESKTAQSAILYNQDIQ
jgi:hypothetical protein